MGFCGGSLVKNLANRNILGYMRNSLVDAIHKQVLLPKAIVVVLEDDLLDVINHYRIGASDAINPCIEWLVTEFHCITVVYKEKLPSKSRKFCYPQILWIAATYHNGYGNGNYYREKFNRELKLVNEKYREMHTLYLPSWDPQGKHSVTAKKLTAHGFVRFWSAVNDAFQSWDESQMKNAHASQSTAKSRKSSSFRHIPKENRDNRQRSHFS